MAIEKKTKILGAVLELLNSWTVVLLDSSANPAHLPQKWAELAVLFSWYVAPKRP